MRIRIRLFALQRVQTGRREHDLALPEGATVVDAWAALVEEFPVLATAAQSVAFARNGRYVETSEPLAEGDELAIIPPVAGGAGGGRPGGRQRPEPPGEAGAETRVRRLGLVSEPLAEGALEALRAAVAGPADGAVALFVGQARESPGTPAPGQEEEAARFAGQRVTGLTYEAYEPMALAELERIAEEIEERFGVRRLAILHRIGEVGVGEASVVIAAAAPHREAAFEACRYAIEELKARAPIWKSERFADGRVWLGAPPRSGPAD